MTCWLWNSSIFYTLGLNNHRRIALTPDIIHNFLQDSENNKISKTDRSRAVDKDVMLKTKNLIIKPKAESQAEYIKQIRAHEINFGVGPAGTGKTYLAVACAVVALEASQVDRIVIARPAVEAGERLGFLPGDLSQKVDPYLRPIYDALYDMVGVPTTSKLIEKGIVEVAPLAFMRGRTLSNAFIILDEAQNTTISQMKMFLTRIGFGSKVVVTGDVTQTDLPSHLDSGLAHALKVLEDIADISITRFSPKDVVRHRLIQKVVEAYEKNER